MHTNVADVMVATLKASGVQCVFGGGYFQETHPSELFRECSEIEAAPTTGVPRTSTAVGVRCAPPPRNVCRQLQPGPGGGLSMT
jgi:hypothetical protein